MNGNVSKATVPTPAGADARQPLDEVMLAMDIVDTIRRRERMVQRELDAEGREIDLKERLRKIYAAQGIDIPDHVLEQGVAAIKEDRFVYTPAAPGFPRTLATLYVTRNAWGKWLLGAIAAVMIAAAGYYAAVVAPAARLPGRIEALHAQIAGITEDAEARTQAGQIREAGLAAVQRGDAGNARAAVASLEELLGLLEQDYTLRVVNRPGEYSGVYRIPDLNEQARNYYVIVEAIDSRGNVLTVPILSEETGATERVKAWGLRVDEDVFNAVANDMKDDGIIQNNRFGEKKRGRLTADYTMPTTGAAITAW